MSKHAVEAFGDTLALEMAKFDVKVSVIEPGNYQSSISESWRKRMEDQDQTAGGSLYSEEWKRMLESPSDRAQYKEPDEVSAAAVHFMTSDEPLHRYMVVPAEGEADWTIRQAIRELVQLNEWQAYKYDRETLIRMLDEAMGVTAP
jgi:NAD(P)-dependent dehydrogenase (short-subunit alcohol dehydrogenase family)